MKTARRLSWMLLFTIGCSSQHDGPKRPEADNPQETQAASDGGFTVFITLSERAKKQLVEGKETMVVAAYVTGAPKQRALERYVNQIGEVELGDARQEITLGENARFGRIPLKQDAFEQTDKKDPELLINVASGRKSSENNLLECSTYQGSLQAVQGGSIRISCKLIDE